jgi:tetratricopeptide (TPR) repeat protein
MDVQRFQHAISLLDSGKLDEAASELHSMYEELLDVSHEEAGLMLLNEAVCLSRQGQPLEECRALLNQASELLGKEEAKRALVKYTEGSFYMGYGNRNPAKALEKFDEVLRRHAGILHEPKENFLYAEIQLRRALMLVELKRFREAKPVMEEVLSLDVEKDSDFYFDLGICYMELRDSESAKQQFLRALDMGLPKERTIKAHFYLGVVYFRLRAYGQALKEFEFCEANIHGSTLPLRGLYKWLALTCRNVGREENARRYSELARSA